jgi:hypothetical protein
MHRELSNAERDQFIKITTVTRNGEEMRGVVAICDIPQGTVVCTYQGDITKEKDRDAFTCTLTPDARRKHTAYDMIYPATHGLIIVPVDDQGIIKKEYINNHALFINEASNQGEWPNVEFAECLTAEDSIDILTLRDIKAGDELLAYYGTKYERTWSVWWCEEEQRLKQREKSRARLRVTLQQQEFRTQQIELQEQQKALQEQQLKLQEDQRKLQEEQAKLQREQHKIAIRKEKLTSKKQCVGPLRTKTPVVDLTEDVVIDLTK